VNASEKIRLFLAIFPPAPVLEKIEKCQQELRSRFSTPEIRWTNPAQIHLTLHFFGSVSRAQSELFSEAIESVLKSENSFRLRAEGVGCFPTMKRPRILWAGLTDETGALLNLKTKLDQRLASVGCEIETRKFDPHLTFARVKQLRVADIRRFPDQIAAMESTWFGDWNVRKIQLTQSQLSPKGALYSPLKEFSLQ
jgi:2'-5' RNA ligase